MSEKSKKRNYQIDNIRAIAILLVVIGHSIIIYSSSWGIYTSNRECIIFDYLKDIINLMQMPIFFAVSGFLFSYSAYRKKYLDIIKDKGLRLLIPYLFFAFLWVVPIRLLVQYPGYKDKSLLVIIGKCILYGSDNGHLWYLITLFWIFAFVKLFVEIFTKFTKALRLNNSVINEHTICACALLLFSALIFVLGKAVNLMYFNSVSQYMIYFSFGFIIQHFYERICKAKGIVKYTLAIVFIVSVFFCIWKKTGFMHLLFSILSSSIIIVLVFMIVPDKRINIMSYFASVSFGVYLFHSPLVYISFTYFPNISPALMFIINFGVWGFVSLVLTQIFKKSKLKLVIGEYR